MYKRLGWAFRRRLMLPVGIEPFDERSYIQKVLNPDAGSGYDPASLIGFWPQNEGAGLISYDHSGLGHHGAYTGVTLGQPGVPGMGMTSPYYDGANDFNNIYSAALAAAFNGTEGTFLIWSQVDAAIWTDGTLRRLVTLHADAQNNIGFFRTAVNNEFSFLYRANNVLEQVTLGGNADTDFLAWAMTWSDTAEEMRAYKRGAPYGAVQVNLGTWVGPLLNTQTVIGAFDTVANFEWLGRAGPALFYSTALSPTQIAYLSTI